jgi:hypothetical protein
LVLSLMIQDPRWTAGASAGEPARARTLPEIKTLSCR